MRQPGSRQYSTTEAQRPLSTFAHRASGAAARADAVIE